MNVDQQRITQLASALSEQMIGTFQENLEDNGCFILYVNNSNRELEGQPSVELYSVSERVLDAQVRHQQHYVNVVPGVVSPLLTVQGVWTSKERAVFEGIHAGPAVFSTCADTPLAGITDILDEGEEYLIDVAVEALQACVGLQRARRILPVHEAGLFDNCPPEFPIPAWIYRITNIMEGEISAFIPAYPSNMSLGILRDICVSKWGHVCADMRRLHVVFSDEGEATWNTNMLQNPEAAAAQVAKIPQ